MTRPTSVTDVEQAFMRYRNLYGHLVAERFSGRDLDMEPVGAERSRWLEQRDALAGSGPTYSDLRLLDLMTSTMRELEEWVPLEGQNPVTDLRRNTVSAYATIAAAVPLGDEILDRLSLFERTETEVDQTARRAAFTAMAPIWEAVDGDGGPDSPYRRLLPASAAAWADGGFPLRLGAGRLGLDSDGIEADLIEILRSFRRLLPEGTIEPWDYRFVCASAEQKVPVPLDSLQHHNDRHLDSLGAPGRPEVRYHIMSGPDRSPLALAFTLAENIGWEDDGVWRAAAPIVFASYATGGLGHLSELVHESGHALHYLATRARPAEFDWPADTLPFVEAVGELVAWNVSEPTFVKHNFDTTISAEDARLYRYGPLMLDLLWTLFEVELHRHPDRQPNQVWAELAESHLGVAGHSEWSWWAVRGQLIETPGYLSNYALGGIVVAALRRRMGEVRPEWFMGDGGWYEFASEHLFRFGATLTSGEIIEGFLGEPLTTKAILADLEG